MHRHLPERGLLENGAREMGDRNGHSPSRRDVTIFKAQAILPAGKSRFAYPILFIGPIVPVTGQQVGHLLPVNKDLTESRLGGSGEREGVSK